MTQVPLRVLVSVLNFNSGGRALTTIECLVRQRYQPLDVIVVDNASRDGSREAIEAAYPGIPVINTGANLGYCGGNNAALDYGLSRGYDAVVIANHDIEIAPDAIERLVRVATEQPSVGIVGAQEVDGASGEPRVLGGLGYNYWSSRRRWIKRPEAPMRSDQPIEMRFVQGAFLLVTREALSRGVRLNEDMFAYVDEFDLGLRVAEAGLRAYVDPAVSIQHRSHATPFGAVEGYLMQRNRWYMVRHHGTRLQRLVNLGWTMFAELPAKVFLRTAQGHGRYARACVLGFVDGLRGIIGIGRVGNL